MFGLSHKCSLFGYSAVVAGAVLDSGNTQQGGIGPAL